MKTRYASWGIDKTFRWLWQAALQDAIFAFKNRYRANREDYKRSSSPWVSVRDQLPEEGQYICLTDDTKSPFGNVTVSDYTIAVTPNWSTERYKRSKVTHWMKIPELEPQVDAVTYELAE